MKIQNIDNVVDTIKKASSSVPASSVPFAISVERPLHIPELLEESLDRSSLNRHASILVIIYKHTSSTSLNKEHLGLSRQEWSIRWFEALQKLVNVKRLIVGAVKYVVIAVCHDDNDATVAFVVTTILRKMPSGIQHCLKRVVNLCIWFDLIKPAPTTAHLIFAVSKSSAASAHLNARCESNLFSFFRCLPNMRGLLLEMVPMRDIGIGFPILLVLVGGIGIDHIITLCVIQKLLSWQIQLRSSRMCSRLIRYTYQT